MPAMQPGEGQLSLAPEAAETPTLPGLQPNRKPMAGARESEETQVASRGNRLRAKYHVRKPCRHVRAHHPG